MPSINLLPKDLLPDPSVMKFSKLLRSLVTIGLALFVVVAVGLGAYFIVNSVTLQNSLKNQNTLKESIKALEETEQGLVLVKDRLQKVKNVYTKPSIIKEVEGLSSILSSIPDRVVLTEAVLGNGTIDTSFTVENSTILTQLMANIIINENYQRIDLLSFSFNPSMGYITSFSFVGK
jgi:hypothetical protein